MNAVFDTNILIDYLNGIPEARAEIWQFDRPMISPITWMEVLVGASIDEEPVVRRFLDRFVVVGLDTAVAEKAVAIRREHRLRLPDAIIWATAKVSSALLITRNTRDFPEADPSIRVPYRIG
ncbi:MAG: type II toxin-antitoxin system VapC family toxin [Thiotrichales bacterium]